MKSDQCHNPHWLAYAVAIFLAMFLATVFVEIFLEAVLFWLQGGFTGCG